MLALRSCRMVPIHSRADEILNDVERFGSNAITSALAKGSSVSPTDINRCPKARIRPPSTSVTVPSAPMLRSPESSEEHTSELQSPDHLVCRLLLEKKKKQNRKRKAQ